MIKLTIITLFSILSFSSLSYDYDFKKDRRKFIIKGYGFGKKTLGYKISSERMEYSKILSVINENIDNETYKITRVFKVHESMGTAAFVVPANLLKSLAEVIQGEPVRGTNFHIYRVRFQLLNKKTQRKTTHSCHFATSSDFYRSVSMEKGTGCPLNRDDYFSFSL